MYPQCTVCGCYLSPEYEENGYDTCDECYGGWSTGEEERVADDYDGYDELEFDEQEDY